MELMENETIIGTGKTVVNGKDVCIDVYYGNYIQLPDGKKYALRLDQYEQLLALYIEAQQDKSHKPGSIVSVAKSSDTVNEHTSEAARTPDEKTSEPIISHKEITKPEPEEYSALADNWEPDYSDDEESAQSDYDEVSETAYECEEDVEQSPSEPDRKAAIPLNHVVQLALLFTQAVIVVVIVLIVLGVIPVGILTR